MKFLMWLTTFFIIYFPMCGSPISSGAVLVVLSFCFVSLSSLWSSWWYSYILFLVYIGGLLVMFIYVCLISSNSSFGSSNSYLGLFVFSVLGTYAMSIKPFSKMFLGASLYDCGEGLINDSMLWLFGALVVLLLVMMLVVVRSSGIGAVSIDNENT